MRLTITLNRKRVNYLYDHLKKEHPMVRGHIKKR